MWKADIWIVLLESFSDKQKTTNKQKSYCTEKEELQICCGQCFDDRGASKASLLQLWAAH